MNVLEHINKKITFLDGGMGSLLQARGLKPGELPERWNVTHADDIIDIQKSYFDAGTNIVLANTFGANCLKFEEDELNQLIDAAIKNARKAAELSTGKQEKFVALDIGSIGRLLKPYGDYEFEDAVKVYGKTVEIGAKCGADLVFIETMNDSYDTKAALLAAKENCELPVFVSNAYGEDGKLMTGASPAAMVAMLEGMHADAIGMNCSLGPAQLKGVIDEYLRCASVPVLLKPNAGLPRSVDGKTVYDVLPEEFASLVAGYVKDGVRIVGGCCGTTPDYIKATHSACDGIEPVALTAKNRTVISSNTHAVEFDKQPILIGERINPTGKKRFKEALRNNEIDYILKEGLTQEEKGAHVLDVNVGLPEIDEVQMLKTVTYELQSIINLPLQIDTTDPVAMEAALRLYNGKAMINSVNGKDEVMREIFPLVKKYGGLVVALTLDEDGIPDNAAKRVEIAKHIIEVAAEYGISKNDLIFDTLAMTVSADSNAALATLEALHTIKTELGCHTSLGVSNVSFGLPNREVITAAFFNSALERGLSAAIMNPNAAEMMKTYYCFRALHGLDENCGDYITNIEKYVVASASAVAGATGANGGAVAGAAGTSQDGAQASDSLEDQLQKSIVKGLKEQSANLTVQLLETKKPLEIVNEIIIPALDIVGKGFEAKTMYLPQLLMSAEASQYAFNKIKEQMAGDSSDKIDRGKFVIATVKGDIHDIGKNIVKLILENYGFDVIDLGKDVDPQLIVDTAIESGAPMVGMSALMTTTVPAMEETIKLLKEQAPNVKTLVGGAVLTQEYSDMIGADYYCKDAMATVRFAMEVVGG